MNRKKFIQQSSLATLGLWSAAKGYAKQDIVLGHNNKKYRIDTHWGSRNAVSHAVNDCHEMVQDSKGRILLLTNETKNNIIIYDKKGKITESWGSEYPGAHGLTLFNENGTDVLFICDTQRHEVIKTTLAGRVLLSIGFPKESGLYGGADEFVPTETAIAANGDIYIADGYGKDYILHYNAKGEYLGYFGGRGNGNEHLLNAHGICIDNRGNTPTLLVSSRQQQAFKRYALDGKYLATIPMPGAWVCRPVIKGQYLYAAVLQSQSHLWQQSGFVTILNQHNQVISNIGGSTPAVNNLQNTAMYQTIKVFQYPHDVCIDDEENLYVCQWNSGKTYPYKLTPVST
jgi:peptidylamidoglycolate lyase